MGNNENKKKYDVVVALGKNWNKDKSRLSIDSRLTSLAAEELLKSGRTNSIIFSGGYTAGDGHPPEAEEMDYYIKRTHPEYGPRTSIEYHSLDTSENAQNVREFLEGNEKVGLLSVGHHFPRAQRIFNSYGINVDTLVSEDVLQESGHFGEFIKKYHSTPHHIFEKFKEVAILNPISWIDRKGLALRKITSKIRH